jgi:pSer/pThr/pTyr-binding forkhead associated (FHA) protein
LIRITHLTGSLQGTASLSPKAVIRIGRGEDCDVRFDARLDAQVSTHHAEIRASRTAVWWSTSARPTARW